jgi:23S rRNA pseudouridine1911/1915/1917 synthase
MTSLRTLTADRGDQGHRLDLVLRRHLSDVGAASRTRLQDWIDHGRVTVNARRATRAAMRLAIGDRVQVDLPAAAIPRPIAPEALPIRVLYEDDHLLAVDKPAGLVVHPTHRHASGTLLNGLLWRARTWASGERPSLVGRLDKQTSGLVLVAKTAAVHAALQRLLARPHAEKIYLAVVYGRVGPTRGQIDLALGRDPHDRRRVVASTGGAASLTRFERVARVSAPPIGLALLRCTLVTGRTHQIRAHLHARGWPLVGDPVYSKPLWQQIDDPAVASAARAFPRQALHAWRLSVEHPATGRPLVITSPMPDDMRALVRGSGLSRGTTGEEGTAG